MPPVEVEISLDVLDATVAGGRFCGEIRVCGGGETGRLTRKSFELGGEDARSEDAWGGEDALIMERNDLLLATAICIIGDWRIDADYRRSHLEKPPSTHIREWSPNPLQSSRRIGTLSSSRLFGGHLVCPRWSADRHAALLLSMDRVFYIASLSFGS